MIKTYEKFKEIYKLNTEEPVVIRDEYLDKVDSLKYVDNVNDYKGKPGKMEYQSDDFFSYLEFDDRTVYLPSYMLINQKEYETNKAVKKYNL